MTTRKITAVALVLAALLLGVWDVIVAYNGVEGDTISEILRDVSHSVYTLPFALGVVMGHLFCNRKPSDMLPRKEHIRRFFTHIGSATALVALVDIINYWKDAPPLAYGNTVAVALGFLAGAAWWPQQTLTAPSEPDAVE